MATFGAGNPQNGLVQLKQLGDGQAVVSFSPLPGSGDDGEEGAAAAKLVEFDLAQKRAIIYPLDTLPLNGQFGSPKYSVLRRISLPYDDELPREVGDLDYFFDGLPRGLTRDPQFGLGFPRAYGPLVRALEDAVGCREIALVDRGEVEVRGDKICIPMHEFESVRAEMDRIVARAQTAGLNVKVAYSQNWINEKLGRPRVPYKRGRHPMVQAFSDAAADSRALGQADVEELVESFSLGARRIADLQPQAIAKLRDDIELVALDNLIERFEAMLGGGHRESVWQRFFAENPFILSFGLGYPVIVVHEQASVGGMRISGRGEKIGDFLLRHAVTSNIALVEIKKPTTRLLNATPYREGVYAPAAEFVGSITQLLDQKYHFQTEFAVRKLNSRDTDMESYSVRTCLIAGLTPGSADEVKSLELFRNTLREVNVVTFDELLQHVRHLRSILQSDDVMAGDASSHG